MYRDLKVLSTSEMSVCERFRDSNVKVLYVFQGSV